MKLYKNRYSYGFKNINHEKDGIDFLKYYIKEEVQHNKDFIKDKELSWMSWYDYTIENSVIKEVGTIEDSFHHKYLFITTMIRTGLVNINEYYDEPHYYYKRVYREIYTTKLGFWSGIYEVI